MTNGVAGLLKSGALLMMGLLALSLTSCSPNQEGSAMAAEPLTRAEIPPIDRDLPEHIETATFALG